MERLHRATSAALNVVLTRRDVFWGALTAGLTAPTMLFTSAPSYTGLIRDFSVAGSFAQVGALMTKSARDQA